MKFDCDKCELRNTCKKPVWGQGNLDSKLMIVGEAPGQEEDGYGLPFVGRSGFLLEKQLVSVGIDPDYPYYTNIVKCRPPKNATPKHLHIKTCRSWLIENEIPYLPNLKIIVCLGATPYKGIVGKNIKITQEHGQFIEWETYKIITIFHPSYCMKQPSLEPGSRKHTAWLDWIKVAKELYYSHNLETLWKLV